MESVNIRDYSRLLAFFTLYAYDIDIEAFSGIDSFDWYEEASLFEKDDVLPVIPESIKREVYHFAREMVSGTLSNLPRIDRQIEEFLVNWKFDRLLPVDKAILRLGVYSLMYRFDIPCEVTIFECNELANEFSDDNTYKYINGILHNVKLRFRRNFLMDKIHPAVPAPKKKFKIKRTGSA
ncbi:MAG: transcription antitermination factor NusB [Brevinematales bacterium]|nr:transcription antitermination factor NusB [Brevinematales bacterium]